MFRCEEDIVFLTNNKARFVILSIEAFSPKVAIEMQLGFATLQVIARDRVPEQSLDRFGTGSTIFKKGLLRFVRNDKETGLGLYIKSQLLKLIGDSGFTESYR